MNPYEIDKIERRTATEPFLFKVIHQVENKGVSIKEFGAVTLVLVSSNWANLATVAVLAAVPFAALVIDALT